MLYTIGTQLDIDPLKGKFPDSVIEKLHSVTVTLDEWYGINRDALSSGGFSVIAENEEDLTHLPNAIDLFTSICEWVDYIPGSPAYISVLYLLGDDFSVVIFMPISIAPQNLIDEIDDLNFKEENKC